MSTVERIRELLDCSLRVKLYDATGKIISPEGAQAAVEATAYKRCLKIAQEEEAKSAEPVLQTE